MQAVGGKACSPVRTEAGAVGKKEYQNTRARTTTNDDNSTKYKSTVNPTINCYSNRDRETTPTATGVHFNTIFNFEFAVLHAGCEHDGCIRRY
ncbi:conserved hypothetical protein [Trichinella spiralis]|uniref:hypothetical protein n=1 Tax=Trichinella spiralis TaxID=6334 RepID=UPI0001EFE9C4|nr:conserved hypothetical protein [Trichinella spiralis]